MKEMNKMINYSKCECIVIVFLFVNIWVLGVTLAFGTAKYIDENHWDPPDHYDMNGTPNLPALIFVTIVTSTVAIEIGFVKWVRKGDGGENDLV